MPGGLDGQRGGDEQVVAVAREDADESQSPEGQ
jgi:hypothetical protein